MKHVKIKKGAFYLGLSALFLFSCSNDESAINKSNNEIENDKGEAILAFPSKDAILQAVKSTNISSIRTRATNAATGNAIESSHFISLTDKVLPNDPVLNEVSEEEKRIILEEGMTYYDMYGCEEYLPSLNFARLLNSNREIRLNDSIYKITEFGTLTTSAKDRLKLDDAYSSLKAYSLSTDILTPKFSLAPGVVFTPYDNYTQDSSPKSKTTAENLPTERFKHYSAESKTFVGKIIGKVLGDRSVKHDEFMKKRRVNGSLYSYNYLVYHETGCFVSMSKKRGGLFKFINGWKDIPAEELFMQYKGLVLEMNVKVPTQNLPKNNFQQVFTSYSYFKVHGLDHTFNKTIDICGLEVKEKDLYKLIGQGTQEIFNILRSWLKDPSALDKTEGGTAIRIITPESVYVVIPNDTYIVTNKEKMRKVFDSGVLLYISISNGGTWKNFLETIRGYRNMPVKKLIGGEVLLAGKLNNKWGGMFIKKETN